MDISCVPDCCPVMTPIAGKMSDLYGKKKVLLILLTMYIVGIAAGGFADNISFLLAGRIIQGVGFAKIPADFQPAQRYVSTGQTCNRSGGVWVCILCWLGSRPVSRCHHNPEPGWHSTFFAIVPFASVVTLMIAKFVKENKGQFTDPIKIQNAAKKRVLPSIDIKGALALSITIITFLLALTLVQSGINSRNLPQIEAAFAVSVVSLAIFVIIERKMASPLVDMRLLRDKTLLPSYIILMVTGIMMFMTYPAIVQLVRSPVPLGFGGDPVTPQMSSSIYDHVPGICIHYTADHK